MVIGVAVYFGYGYRIAASLRRAAAGVGVRSTEEGP